MCILYLSLLGFMLAGCGGPKLTAAPTLQSPGDAIETPTPTVTPTIQAIESSPCHDGKLTVGDLPAIDASWQAGLRDAEVRASNWQPDATLTTLRVSCQLFQAGFRWQATFYSPSAQAFYASDTGDVSPSGVDPAAVPSLASADLSFGLLHRALAKSGLDDSTVISASTGVDVRMNTLGSPFGPPSAPKDVVLYHVAIDKLGEVKDIFVDGDDGTVYRYTA